MAVITLTASNIVPSSNSSKSLGIAGETLTAGLFAYLKDSDNKWWKADATTLEKSGNRNVNKIRMVTNDAVAGQTVGLLEPGSTVDVGAATVTKGLFYYLSESSGKMCSAFSDITSGKESLILGFAPTTGSFTFNPIFSGVTV